MIKKILTALFLFLFIGLLYPNTKEKIVYKFDIKEEIAPPAWRQTQAAFKQAEEVNADYILIHLNTYGGAVDVADKIRTKILECKKPVLVFIDNNAASAGALISIACDSIYMRSGANIGAATVVDAEGKPLPEKYQSYMRSTLRSTAEATGRDPKIAEAMNDPRIYIPGINDSGKVISFTVNEAIKNGYCKAKAETIAELLKVAQIEQYKLIEYKETTIESIVDFLLNPVVSGILIMVIVAGIYFELQAPGIGLPLFLSITAAVLYFAPHYLEGLAANWEILLFVVGVLLLLVEIFIIPGFGVAGILGIICIVLGLTLALIANIPNSPIEIPSSEGLYAAFFTVITSIGLSLTISIILGRYFLKSSFFGKFVLSTKEETDKGYSSSDKALVDMVGKIGEAYTILRPSGKVKIENTMYDAVSELGYIEKDEKIQVTRYESAQLFVKKV